jgi:hypothetical protein
LKSFSSDPLPSLASLCFAANVPLSKSMEIEEVEDADGNKPAPKPDKEAREAIKVRPYDLNLVMGLKRALEEFELEVEEGFSSRKRFEKESEDKEAREAIKVRVTY